MGENDSISNRHKLILTKKKQTPRFLDKWSKIFFVFLLPKIMDNFPFYYIFQRECHLKKPRHKVSLATTEYHMGVFLKFFKNPLFSKQG